MWIRVLYSLILVACGAAATNTSDEDVDSDVTEAKDAGPSPPDSGSDAKEPLPKRPNINERWAEFEDCYQTDSVIADEKLYLLCKGTRNRLMECPLDRGLETTTCEEYLAFEGRPYLDGEPLEVAPLVHNRLNDQFSLTGFTSLPDNYPAFSVIDHLSPEITKKRAKETEGVRVGNDVIQFQPNHISGAYLLGESNLLVATRNKDLKMGGDNFMGGTVLLYGWNRDGTVTATEDELGLDYLFTTYFDPAYFLPAQENNCGWLLENAGVDLVCLDGEGNPAVDEERAISFGDVTLEYFKHPVMNANEEALLLASQPDGGETAKLFGSELESFELGEGLSFPSSERIRSAQWHPQNSNQAFVTVAAEPRPLAYHVTVEGGEPASLSDPLEVFGEEPVGSVVYCQEQSCIYYVGLNLSDTTSAVTAIQESAWDAN